MKKILLIASVLIGFYSGYAQNSEVLADSYYKKGEFKKALVIYENLNREKPYSYKYIYKLVETHQQLEQFDDAERLLTQRLTQRRNPTLLVELGYNYQLKDTALTY